MRNFKIGRWDILPDFAGALLLGAFIGCLGCHKMQAEAEKKVKVLLEEIAERIRSWQPNRANLLKAAGTGIVLLHKAHCMASVYGYESCCKWMAVFLLMVWGLLFIAVLEIG